MARQEDRGRRVSAIIPVYNEGERVQGVLEPLLKCKEIEEIVVVDDGSTDNTAEVISKYPVKYIRLEKNGGKGAAMERGVQEAKNEVILFCDGDLLGVNPHVIRELTTPVLQDEIEMFVAMQNRKSYALRFLILFVPLLGGLRVLTKKLWNELPEYYKTGFRIEVGLNFFAKYYGKGFRFKVFPKLTQVIKEKKYGFWEGSTRRLGMMWHVLQAQLKLQFIHIPSTLTNRRKFLLSSFSTFIGVCLSIIILYAVYRGPRRFLFDLFAEKLATDTHTPIIQFLFYITTLVGVDFLLLFGITLLIINIFIFFMNFEKLLSLFRNYKNKIILSGVKQDGTSKIIQGEKRG